MMIVLSYLFLAVTAAILGLACGLAVGVEQTKRKGAPVKDPQITRVPKNLDTPAA